MADEAPKIIFEKTGGLVISPELESALFTFSRNMLRDRRRKGDFQDDPWDCEVILLNAPRVVNGTRYRQFTARVSRLDDPTKEIFVVHYLVQRQLKPSAKWTLGKVEDLELDEPSKPTFPPPFSEN